MPILAVVTREAEALPLIRWAVHCALARRDNVVVVHPAQRGQHSTEDAAEIELLGALPDDAIDRAIVEAIHHTIRAQLGQIAEEAGPFDASEKQAIGCPVITALRIDNRAPTTAVLDQVKALSASLLLVAQHEAERGEAGAFSLPRQLLQRCPCDMLMLRPGAKAAQTPKRILVPAAGGPHANVALRLAADIGLHTHARVEAMFVEPRIGAEAQAVGEAILERTIRRALGSDAQHVGRRVVIANDFRRGIASVAEDGYDLVLVGASNHLTAKKVLFNAVPEKLIRKAEAAGTSVAVLRRAIPARTRFAVAGRRLLERMIPQLDRDARLSLVERVQGNSRWDFDFVSLIALSTLIAALGLIISSVAVVIGAMLVAPLMTPLVGCGLALVQGNVVLIRHAIRAVVLGFVLAFSIGLAIGLGIPGVGLTSEIMSRTQPNVLDLGVAFVSGLAAAYATARPNLSGALPGVAIAAALVPPIASSGLCLALGHPALAAGAALLFATNIVAIVLGSALVLFAVGMRAGHTHGRDKPWVRRGYVALIVASAMLAVPLSYLLYEKIRDTPADLIAQVRAVVEAQPQTRYVQMLTPPSDDEPGRVTITAPQPASRALADDLSRILSAYYQRPVTVEITTQLITRSNTTADP